jgi:tetratricopeptide (TPR) repeat protein
MRERLEESRAGFLSERDSWGVGFVGLFLSVARDAVGDRAGADTAYRESLESFAITGDRLGAAYARLNYGEVLRARGEDERAAALYEEALAVFRESGERTGAAISALNLGMLLSRHADIDRATDLLAESVLFVRDGCKVLLPVCLAGMGGLAVARGEPLRAATLFGAAERAGEQSGAGLQYADRVYYDQQVAALRAALNSTDLDAAWARGRAMGEREAILLALDGGARPFQGAVVYSL